MIGGMNGIAGHGLRIWFYMDADMWSGGTTSGLPHAAFEPKAAGIIFIFTLVMYFICGAGCGGNCLVKIDSCSRPEPCKIWGRNMISWHVRTSLVASKTLSSTTTSQIIPDCLNKTSWL
jgi:hypothetical protein